VPEKVATGFIASLIGRDNRRRNPPRRLPLHGFGRSDRGMELKLNKISHDTVSKETVLILTDIFEPYPSITIHLKVMTTPQHTEADIEALVKAHAREALQSAIRRCS
jgi:hypothetical protein